jgi:large conductance mechanosensitive channel
MKNFVYKDQPPVVIRYGKFVQSILSLLIIAFALFFLIKGINQLHKITQRNKEQIQDNEVTEEVKVLCEIRDLLTRQSPSIK